MSDPSDSLTSSSKGNHMYLVKNGSQLIASYETHEAAFDYFRTVGGFAVESLHIEKGA